jgi:hypothetical protein
MLFSEGVLVVTEVWWSSWIKAIAPYAVLLRAFADRRIDADEFEILFLQLYKSDGTQWSDDLFELLDSFFARVDAYCADPELRERVGGLDEDALRGQAVELLARLSDVAG